jgi:ABC-2 type transport system ATP-binding protein
VEAVCDRVQILHRGSIVYSDTIGALRRFRGAHALLLGLRRAPAPEELLRLPGIVQVEPAVEGLLRVIRAEAQAGADAVDPTEALVRASVERNWGLYHLAPERATLEDVFVQLTQQEGAADTQGEPAASKDGGAARAEART